MRGTKDKRDDWDGLNDRDKLSRVYIRKGSLQPLSSLNLNPKWHNLGKLILAPSLAHKHIIILKKVTEIQNLILNQPCNSWWKYDKNSKRGHLTHRIILFFFLTKKEN